MGTSQNTDDFLDALVTAGLYSNKGNLKMMLDTLFSGINFTNKKFLEIGGGTGLCSFYAAYRGASKVVCLEPEEDGSTQGVVNKFNSLNNKLTNNTVRLKSETFQTYSNEGELFDVLLLHDSINHLNEEACINILKDDAARLIYKKLFTKMWSILNSGAIIIICDCSRHNFFNSLGMPNPFIPMIEWQKHQAPETWIKLLREVGFINPSTEWSSFNSLRQAGKFLLGNKIMAYFLLSHFRITLEKPQ
jgi:SAM-dependent methyltransferase